MWKLSESGDESIFARRRRFRFVNIKHSSETSASSLQVLEDTNSARPEVVRRLLHI